MYKTTAEKAVNSEILARLTFCKLKGMKTEVSYYL
jgi:hypothetical protein